MAPWAILKEPPRHWLGWLCHEIMSLADQHHFLSKCHIITQRKVGAERRMKSIKTCKCVQNTEGFDNNWKYCMGFYD